MSRDNASGIWDGLPEEWQSTEDFPETPAKEELSVGSTAVQSMPTEAIKTALDYESESQKDFERTGQREERKKKQEKKAYNEYLKKQKADRSANTNAAYLNERKGNRKDFLIFGAIAAIVIIAITVFVFISLDSGNQKIFDHIEKKNYITAYQEIKSLYEKGKNVDELACTMIHACISDGEYKRAISMLPMLSSEAASDTDFFREIVETLVNRQKANRAEEVLDFMMTCESDVQSLAMELKEQYHISD